MKKKKIASISLDLDNQWSYMKIHGDEGWESYPSYFEIFVPYVLDLLDELELKITVFIVGKDAVDEKNVKYLKMISERGHEVGNHSFKHESWLQKYSRKELEEEIDTAIEAINKATGQQPNGFRGPGFSWSMDLLEVLEERGYMYDASTLPTYIGPLARMYYFWKSDLSKKEKKERGELFGTFKDGLRKLKPYYHKLPNGKKILEIPVTTIPVIKIPFHLSYLLYLSGISKFLMKFYLGFAIFMCKITNTTPSFLLHPLDVIGGDQITQLAFFPGMNIESEKKAEVFKYVINLLKKHYDLSFMSTHAERHLN
ncbi:MAG: polysaccharide deacetylase family protein [Bacteroidetes bacterium]|nr:polysaccharide deacetylase family protein [Bacteroidota bacterium]